MLVNAPLAHHEAEALMPECLILLVLEPHNRAHPIILNPGVGITTVSQPQPFSRPPSFTPLQSSAMAAAAPRMPMPTAPVCAGAAALLTDDVPEAAAEVVAEVAPVVAADVVDEAAPADLHTTLSGTSTPAVSQIFFAYETAASWSACGHLLARQQAMPSMNSEFLQMQAIWSCGQPPMLAPEVNCVTQGCCGRNRCQSLPLKWLGTRRRLLKVSK
jgi:hypothetical protein